MIEFRRNEGSWCSSNALRELEAMTKRGECLCRHTKFEYVREATKEDEESNRWGQPETEEDE